jgi:hypothetical protein
MAFNEIAESVVGQLAFADATLRSRLDGLRLSGLELCLCGAVTSLDGSLALDVETLGTGSALDLTFHLRDASSITGLPVQVPYVVGYTTALARRKIESAGLRATFTATGDGTGTVTETMPAGGAQSLSGSMVLLTVGHVAGSGASPA